MKCEELLKMLNEYVDGTMDPAICNKFEKHIAGCSPCQVVVDNIRKTITLYQNGQPYKLPVEFRTERHASRALEGEASGQMKHLATWLFLPLLFLVGCSKTPGPTTPPAALTAEVQHAATQRGKAIVAETFSLLSSNLQSAIQQGGVSNALPFCSLAASPLTAGMAGKHGVTIRRVTHKARNPGDKADAIELAILKRFEDAVITANVTNPPPPIVTNFTASMATFFAPIVLNNELCLKCHGEPGKDISPENVAVIQGLYPQDEAIGFKLGDLRDAWRIDFPLATLSAGH